MQTYIDIKRGFNSTVIFDHENGLITKEYGLYSSQTACPYQHNLLMKIIKDSFFVRRQVTACGVNIPKLNTVEYSKTSAVSDSALTASITTTESYCGKTLFELRNCKNWVDKVLKLIESLPKNIELDTNPYNFTIYQGKIYFVDFMPPMVKTYQNCDEIVMLFPSVKKRSLESEERRAWRYNTTAGRKHRFLYYAGKACTLT